LKDLNFFRNKKSDKIFLVEVGREGRDTVKKIYGQNHKKFRPPQVRDTRVLPRGDLTINPADETTYKVLQDIEKEGIIKIREE